jgi:hypothetical protein
MARRLGRVATSGKPCATPATIVTKLTSGKVLWMWTDVRAGLLEESAQAGLVLSRQSKRAGRIAFFAGEKPAISSLVPSLAEHFTAGVADELDLELDGRVLAAGLRGAVVVCTNGTRRPVIPARHGGLVGAREHACVSLAAPVAQQLPAEKSDELAVRPKVATAQPLGLRR